MPNPFAPDDVLFLPPRAAAATARVLEYRREHKAEGIQLGIEAVDRHMTPLLPDNLVTVLGRPRNGKTAIMLWWARTEARRIAARGEENKIVVFVTYEQSMEDLMAFSVASDQGIDVERMARGTLPEGDWDKVVKSLIKSVGLPLAIIGHSAEARSRRPRLTLTNVSLTLERLIDGYGIQPHLVFVDYLQRIPGEKYAGDRRLEVSENLDRCKDGALTYGAPWVVGVQAKREVDKANPPVPMLADGQETANIEQASDKILSVVRPVNYRRQGEDFRGVTVRGHSQMLVTLLKQKLGRDNISEWIEFDPALNRLIESEQGA